MSQSAGGGGAAAAAMRYSQYATGAGVAGPQQQQQQQQQPSAATAVSSAATGAPLVAMRQSGGLVAQQQSQQQQHFMRPPMLVTSSGASMLPPGGGGGGAAGPQQPHTGTTGVAGPAATTNTNGNGGLPKYPGSSTSSSSRDLSGSDTDVSTSNENLSREERYVLSHARVEPQGEENLQGNVTPVNELQGRYIGDKFSSNTSSDSTRYATPTGGSSRSISESRTGTMYSASMGGGGGGGPGAGPGNDGSSNRSSMVGGGGGGGSNRNSLKEPNSNRSSMDVSQSSYNTLIIHDDIYGGAGMTGSGVSAREYAGSPPPYMKKERPRSYGEACQVVMQEISEIPEEYLSQSHVLKHLAKEVKLLPGSTGGVRSTRSASLARDTMASEGKQRGHGPRQHQQQSGSSIVSTDGGSDCKKHLAGDPDHPGQAPGQGGNGKLKSKSQPDLSRLYDIEPEELEALVKENHLLKQQLNNCYLKVAKSQKLEQEIANIYRVHEELVQSCDRRERLERAARTRLQQDCRRLQELNRAFRDQVEVYQSQLHASSDHQLGRTQQDVLISQLVNQNKSLVDANRRQCIELQAQNATLEEQRIHINVLDTALKRLEEECRQKQVYVERCAQLQHALQSLQNASERREQAERKLRIDYEHDLPPNRSGSSSTGSETDNLKWQLREKDAQIMRLEAECSKLEQRNLEESNVRNVAKLAMERNSQETERILAEAKQEKIRYLDEAHAANRKVTELQTRLKLVENRLAEKDAMIRAYQGQKIYGGSTNSYGSYNLSTDSFALNPLGAYNSQPSYVDVSASSYDVVSGGNGVSGSLLDPSVVGPYVGATSGAVVASSYASTYGQNSGNNNNNPSFVQSSLNLPGGGVGSSGSAVGSSMGLNGVGGNVGGGGGNATGCYSSPSSSSTTSNYCSSSTNYGSGTTTTGSSEHTIFDSKNYDAQRKSIDDQLKQLDEQLLNKVSELSMVEKQHQRSQRARALAMAKFKSAATASSGGGGGGSSGLGTSVTSSSANSSTDSNGNLLLAAAVGSSATAAAVGSSAAAAAVTNPAITRHHPASSSPASTSTNLLARGGQRAVSQQQQQTNGGGPKASSAKAQKHHHHHHHQHQNLRHAEQAMAKTISTPAICGGGVVAATAAGGSSSKKAVTTVTIGTGTTSTTGADGATTNQATKKPRAAVSCKNVSTSATDSSTSLSSSSEPETFY
uniref:Angiomotin C-terminal domain-containing protein n=1 Tax=Anopheles braziliensis TaxID=58242 RepID=A0A2M3Z0W2_9DIPT